MREGLILNLRSNISDILRWNMGVMFARSYVLQLGDNIKRSKEQSAKRGVWMGLAPVGDMHAVAGQNFYITANMVMNLAAPAREIFESSEVEEKRELVNLMFQNLKLERKKMLTDIREPFSKMIGYKDHPTNWRWRELNSRPGQIYILISTCLVG
ncbi:hypothetical protein PARA125_000991 [Parachlamydia sp. AcF125]|nr:hypothetical protein [Parachlamydia sp. AcF125]